MFSWLGIQNLHGMEAAEMCVCITPCRATHCSLCLTASLLEATVNPGVAESHFSCSHC